MTRVGGGREGGEQPIRHNQASVVISHQIFFSQTQLLVMNNFSKIQQSANLDKDSHPKAVQVVHVARGGGVKEGSAEKHSTRHHALRHHITPHMRMAGWSEQGGEAGRGERCRVYQGVASRCSAAGVSSGHHTMPPTRHATQYSLHATPHSMPPPHSIPPPHSMSPPYSIPPPHSMPPPHMHTLQHPSLVLLHLCNPEGKWQ